MDDERPIEALIEDLVTTLRCIVRPEYGEGSNAATKKQLAEGVRIVMRDVVWEVTLHDRGGDRGSRAALEAAVNSGPWDFYEGKPRGSQ